MIKFFFPFALFLPLIAGCPGPKKSPPNDGGEGGGGAGGNSSGHCVVDADCTGPTVNICVLWACATGADAGAEADSRGCYLVSNEGAACDNGKPECTGNCRTGMCAVNVVPLPPTCGATTFGCDAGSDCPTDTCCNGACVLPGTPCAMGS